MNEADLGGWRESVASPLCQGIESNGKLSAFELSSINFSHLTAHCTVPWLSLVEESSLTEHLTQCVLRDQLMDNWAVDLARIPRKTQNRKQNNGPVL